jgi:hypothetical protein
MGVSRLVAELKAPADLYREAFVIGWIYVPSERSDTVPG